VVRAEDGTDGHHGNADLLADSVRERHLVHPSIDRMRARRVAG
jgi:hypothetical protein